jgi:hypothetical protein
MEVLKRINKLVDIRKSSDYLLLTRLRILHALVVAASDPLFHRLQYSIGRRSLVVCLWIVLGFFFFFLFGFVFLGGGGGVSFPVWWKGSSGKVAFVEVQVEEKREFVKGMME